jgi:hypothetical protein
MALQTTAWGNLLPIGPVVFCNRRSSLTPFGYGSYHICAVSCLGSFSVLSFVRSTLVDHSAALGYELCLRASSGQLQLQTTR